MDHTLITRCFLKQPDVSVKLYFFSFFGLNSPTKNTDLQIKKAVLLNNCTTAFLKGLYEGKMTISQLATISWESRDWGRLLADRSIPSTMRKSGGGYCNELCGPSQPDLGVSREAVLPRPGTVLVPMPCYLQPLDPTHTRLFRTLQAERLYQAVNRDHRNAVNRCL